MKRPESIARRLLRNVVSNVSGFGVNVAVAFVVTPIVIHSLGDVAYGFWTLVVSITAYYGILDLGLRQAVGQYVARYRAQGDVDGVNRTLNTATVVLAGAGLVLVAATVILAMLLPGWIHADAEATRDAQQALVIVGLGLALGLPLAGFSMVPYACERFVLVNAISIGHRLLFLGCALWVLKAGYGLVGLAAANGGLQLLSWIALTFAARRLLPGLRFSPRRFFSVASLKEMTHFGFFSFLSSTADRIVAYTDVLLVATLFGTVSVTYYAIGANLPPYFVGVVLAVAWTFTPYATGLDAKGDRGALRDLVRHGSRGVAFFATLIATGMFLLGRDFLALWIGETYVSGETQVSAAVILYLLTASALIRLFAVTGHQVILAMRRVRALALFGLVEIVLNLVVSLALAPRMGVVGIAIGALVATIVAHGFARGLYLIKLLDVPLRSYLAWGARGAVPILAAMLTVHFIFDDYIVADSWGRLVLKGILLVVPSVPVALLFSLDRDERRAAFSRPRLRT